MSRAQKITIAILSVIALITLGLSYYKYSNPEDYIIKFARRFDSETTFQSYIQRFPDGKYINEAEGRMELYSLNRSKDDVKLLVDGYFREYPHGMHRRDAMIALDKHYDRLLLQKKTDPYYWERYLQIAPDGSKAADVQEKIKEVQLEKALELQEQASRQNAKQQVKDSSAAEAAAYKEADRIHTAESFAEYLRKFPNGKHASDAKYRMEYLKSNPRPKTSSASSPSNSAPQKPKSKYAGNSLRTGSQPYANVYGNNTTYGEYYVSIKASDASDVVVTIKRGSKTGPVYGHAYIRKGNTYKIYLPSAGTYQVFFCQGIDWNPEKPFKKGLTGAFDTVLDVSYADPIFLGEVGEKIREGVEYKLNIVANGNLETHPCSIDDML